MRIYNPDVLYTAGALTVASLVTIMAATNPDIPELKVRRESSLGIVVEYNYPSDRNKSRMLGIMTSGGSIIFKRDEEGWDVYSQNEIIFERYDMFGFSGKAFLSNVSPNTPYVILKNNFRKFKSLKGEVHVEDYRFFTVFSERELKSKEKELLKVLDEHLRLLGETYSKIMVFRLHLIELPIPSAILNPHLVVVGNKDREIELIHEFAHIYSRIHDHRTLEAAIRLYRDPERFAEHKHFDTEVGHPSSNLSEMIASIITTYALGKDLELTGKDREALQMIVDFYKLDSLREKLNGIVSKRE